MARRLIILLQNLLAKTGASRVTLRQGEDFAVSHEARAPGVPSIRGEQTIDLRRQPVALEVAAGRQVVQADSRAAYDDPEFQRMLEAYGGLAAQIVTPVFRNGEVEAILSLHQLGEPRAWTDEEIQRCRVTAERIAELL
jgi:GAF domain-containing protein